MATNIEIVSAAVSLIIKAALLASRFSGRARNRNLKKLSKMDVDEKDKEIIFLRDKVDRQQLQITILQNGLKKKQTKKRYTLREKMFILSYMEIFQVPRRRVTEYLGIAKSTLYRWLHKIEEKQQSSTPANKTPVEIAALVSKGLII
jgi:transcriptional regulator with PAS, ATPase and Fis domain